MQKLSDESLVRDVQAGSICAFEELVRRYQGKLRSFVFPIVRDRDVANDVVQETMITIYKTIDRINTEKRFATYIYVIARNSAISHLRSKKHLVPLDEALSVASTISLYSDYIDREEKIRIRSIVRSLDTKYYDVISLYYFDDLSYEEISKRLRLPINTIRTHLRRAKEELRKKLI